MMTLAEILKDSNYKLTPEKQSEQLLEIAKRAV